MSAFMIVHGNIKNSEKFKSYSEAAASTLKKFGAELVFKGKVADVLTGNHAYHISAVIKFPEQSVIKQWYDSPDYQQLIPLRDSAADVVFVGVEE